ncbi:MAG: ATP-binding protein, partial [Deltaproteobacteria bacterium]
MATDQEHAIEERTAGLRVALADMQRQRDDAERRARELEALLAEHANARAVARSGEDHAQRADRMEAVGRLAGGVAHDFNNIVSVILASCGFLESDLPEAGESIADVREIRKAAERAGRLTQQMLAFSRRQVLDPRPLEFNAFLRDMHEMLARVAGEHVKVSLHLATDLDLVHADPAQIQQVIVNLTSNARDAMADRGEITMRTANADLDAESLRLFDGVAPGRFVAIEVADTGVGMDAATRSRIFEPFFTTKPKGKGTGLGLSTVYGIVKQSGGFVRVRSEPGAGAAFTVCLPVHVEVQRSPTVAPAAPAAPGVALQGGGEAVLIVEDNAQLQALASRALRQAGFRVLRASGLDEAMQVANAEATLQVLLT